MNARFDSPDRRPAGGPHDGPSPTSNRAVQRRALAALDYESQVAAVRPPGALPPLQLQSAPEGRGERDRPNDRDPMEVALEDLGEVGRTMSDTIEASRRARVALEIVQFELLVRGHGPHSRELGRVMDGMKALEEGLEFYSRPIARVGAIYTVADSVAAVYTNMRAAADTPVDPDVIAADPRAALDGYTAYFRGASAACRGLAVVPVLSDVAGVLADLFDAIPNAIVNLYAVFAAYTERIDAMLEDATEVSYNIVPPTREARREAIALMNDMRHAPDISYRLITARVKELLGDDSVVRSLAEDARDRAAANAADPQQRFYQWLVDPAHSRRLLYRHVQLVHERYERFMLGTGDELRGGTPFTVIGQLANDSSAAAAMQHLLNTGVQ